MGDDGLLAALRQHWAASDANDFDDEHRIYRDDAMPECSVVRGGARLIGDTPVSRRLGRFGAPRRSHSSRRPPNAAAAPLVFRRHPCRSPLPLNRLILRHSVLTI